MNSQEAEQLLICQIGYNDLKLSIKKIKGLIQKQIRKQDS